MIRYNDDRKAEKPTKNAKVSTKREDLEAKFYKNFVEYFKEHKNSYKQADIIHEIQSRYNYTMTQPTISKYISGSFKTPNMFHLLLICSAINLNPCTLMPELRTNMKEKAADILVSDVGTQADYAPYIGIFHCYFFSTISKQSQRDQMHHAIMQIFYDESTDSYQVDFILHANAIGNAKKETEKKYHGTITVLNNLNACYIILQEKCLEYSFLTFRRMTSTQQSMKCCLALALTTGAGQGRNPTAHRMVICRDELSDVGIHVIMPHLRMNSKKILILKQDLETFLKQSNIPEAIKEVISKNVEEMPYYLIREEHLRSLDNYNTSRYIAELREISYSRRHYKVGSVADKLLFDALYEEEHEEYFKSNI